MQLQDAYKSIREALSHAAAYNNRKLKLVSILSDDIHEKNVDQLSAYQGIVIAPGFGSRGVEGKLLAIRFARENKIPCFGICMGMQCMAIEFARNVLGYSDANSTEFDEHTEHNIIDLMEDQKRTINKGGSMRLGAYPCRLLPNSRVQAIYRCDEIKERHRHRYELNHAYQTELERNGLHCSGVNPDSGLTEIIELEGHPWFIGTQFHPEYSSTVLHPHPLFLDFIRKAIER